MRPTDRPPWPCHPRVRLLGLRPLRKNALPLRQRAVRHRSDRGRDPLPRRRRAHPGFPAGEAVARARRPGPDENGNPKWQQVLPLCIDRMRSSWFRQVIAALLEAEPDGLAEGQPVSQCA
jgi:hypothetical protein